MTRLVQFGRTRTEGTAEREDKIITQSVLPARVRLAGRIGPLYYQDHGRLAHAEPRLRSMCSLAPVPRFCEKRSESRRLCHVDPLFMTKKLLPGGGIDRKSEEQPREKQIANTPELNDQLVLLGLSFRAPVLNSLAAVQ